jgi:selenocysteine lyase/cysteine desulfurase
MNISEFKKHFSKTQLIHLNNSGMAPIPDVNRDLALHWYNRIYTEGAFLAVEGWAQTEVTRKKLAQFIGADSSELSFFPTTASALSQAALGIPISAGDEILTWDQEYPSNFYPWRLAAEKNKAKLIQVESDHYQTPAKKILERVNTKTKAIAISWVQFQTGSVTDLRFIADQLKGRNIWLIADVIQGLGVRPFNFHESGFDMICGGSHKFMCSNFGAAFMAIKKEKIDQVFPIEVGAMTYGTPDTEKSFTLQPKPEAKRYEPGSKAMIELIAMQATLDLFMKFGIENIFNEASRLANRFRKGLREKGYLVISDEGPILNFRPQSQNDLEKCATILTKNKVSFAKRGPGIRLSLHAFNQDEEVDAVLSLLTL